MAWGYGDTNQYYAAARRKPSPLASSRRDTRVPRYGPSSMLATSRRDTRVPSYTTPVTSRVGTGALQPWRPPVKAAPEYEARRSSGGGGGWGGSSSSGGGGGGWGGAGGGAGGGVSIPITAAPAPPPEPPKPVMETITVPSALADTEYQRVDRNLGTVLADYLAKQGMERGNYDRALKTSYDRLGFRQGLGKGGFEGDRGWNMERGTGAYGDSLAANSGDFSGRGLGFSGMYVRAADEINDDFVNRLNALNTAREENVSAADITERNLRNQQKNTREDELQNAIRRIAQKYSVQLSDVPTGAGATKKITREKAG